MEMESCTLLKNSVALVRNISMTIDSGEELGIEVFLSRHGPRVMLMVNQPGKLMALALWLRGPSKFDKFEWNEDGYRRIFLELREFISIFELGSSVEESLSVFACPDDPEGKVRFLFIPKYSPHVRIIDFYAIREYKDSPQVDVSSGSTLTMKSFCFQCILDFFDATEVDEGVRDFLWIEIFPDFVRFNIGDKEFDLAQEVCVHSFPLIYFDSDMF
ncbi:hypothetical protein K2173_013477 [Erythroxylum novogranatense]|uniref:Uncharacterized protein n=1 Tax=Erythroxylum novogranatense TaxID=1862640 RepID=A0AAV8SAG6_9ROSI|nr:hypothetical protein K2173_013477 [Erythroxylum novogranatense]